MQAVEHSAIFGVLEIWAFCLSAFAFATALNLLYDQCHLARGLAFQVKLHVELTELHDCIVHVEALRDIALSLIHI